MVTGRTRVLVPGPRQDTAAQIYSREFSSKRETSGLDKAVTAYQLLGTRVRY